jgi:hypothetical protein
MTGVGSNSDIRFVVNFTHNDKTTQTWFTASHVDFSTGEPTGNSLEIYKAENQSGSVTVFNAANAETSVFPFTKSDGFDVAEMACTMFFRGNFSSTGR